MFYRQRTIRENLTNAFPEKSVKELRSIERKFYAHLLDVIIETLWLFCISDKQLNKHIKVLNGELMDNLAKDGKPIIVFLGHYGNWEWAQKITWHFTRPEIKGSIYRPVKDPRFNKFMLKLRGRFGNVLIPQKKAVRTLLGWTKEGKQWAIGFIADQRPNSKNLHNWTTWLSQDTAYALGAEEIGNRVGAHYVYLDVERTKRHHYTMPYCEMEGKEPTLEFMQRLEQTIRKAPQYWLWSHKRWRIKRQQNAVSEATK